VRNQKVLSKAKLEAPLNKLSETNEVFVPMQKKAQSGYYPWTSFVSGQDEIMLEALNVYQPPKGAVLPQTEKMYQIKQGGMEIKIDKTFEDSHPTIIFGARACDVKGIMAMDEVFNPGYEDSFYKAAEAQLPS
jgi:hypothetical protein